jgi:Co/Zn/Cd efflux system component
MSDLVKSLFSISKMDCPSEEKLIRMSLANIQGIDFLKFNLSSRELTVFHKGSPDLIETNLESLNFGASLVQSEKLSEVEENMLGLEKAKSIGKEQGERKVLFILLGINGFMFFTEMTLGLVANSMGLIADSLDMFADAAVYIVSLYAVGKSLQLQNTAARLSGYLQFMLATFALVEVIRRFYFGSDPEPSFMIWVSLVALIANASCLFLILKHRDGGVHMKASLIFSANDVIANLGVILAGILVSVFQSSVPDLIIGAVISVIVFRGAFAILRLARA